MIFHVRRNQKKNNNTADSYVVHDVLGHVLGLACALVLLWGALFLAREKEEGREPGHFNLTHEDTKKGKEGSDTG